MARVELVAILGSLTLLVSILELVRRKQLGAGYALLWLLTALALLILSMWRDLLDVLAHLVGIFYPPTALFVVGFGFLLIILLQFSVVISRLSQENKKLAQRIGLLDWKLRQIHSDETAETQPNAEQDAI
ncbi:MAG: DUF2304 domain-containing protein [Nitrosomonas ureae]